MIRVKLYRLKIVFLFVIFLAKYCLSQVAISSGKWQPNPNGNSDGIAQWQEECGQRIIRGGLAGGRKTRIGDYPYMVLLGYDPDGKVTQYFKSSYCDLFLEI